MLLQSGIVWEKKTQSKVTEHDFVSKPLSSPLTRMEP